MELKEPALQEAGFTSVGEKTKQRDKNGIVICISGLAGTGKSTVAKKIAEKYGLRYYSGGDALKELAKGEKFAPKGRGWWESPAGLSFLSVREKDHKFDKLVDEKLLSFAEQGNVLLDSWTMPWLVKDGFRIWLLASLEKRAERVAKRDGVTKPQALQMLKQKEEKTRAIYKKLYGFDLGEDFKPFDLVLDTDDLGPEEVFNALCRVIDNMITN
jgi:cytidylate kinase